MMKNINTEIIVGLFMLAGFLAFGYLSLQMGEFSIFDLEKNYRLEAEFDNVSGQVGKIELGEQGLARVEMLIKSEVNISADAIASIRTQGLIGDKYIKIIQGADEEMLADGEGIFDTQSSIDFEALVSKYIFKAE
jgi:phospholipid/cholesterol/gamma-HCH transport system substrate-binding protein